MALELTSINHVQVTVPASVEADALRFYGEVLGLKPITKPDALAANGGAWYRLGAFELHVSREDGDSSAAESKRHVCYVVSNLANARSELARHSVPIIEDLQPIAGWSRFYIRDPGGNRIEIAERLAQPRSDLQPSQPRETPVPSSVDVFDRDLDPQPRRSLDPRRVSIGPYQRLIVNPFLAVLLFVIIIALGRMAFRTDTLGLFPFLVLLIVVDVFLVQYHCLDCGATGWLVRYRRHGCATVVTRFQRGEMRRFRGPGVRSQLAMWLILLAAGCATGLIMLVSR
jgi:catechol 2,3-dioxygenase-like lactoylglutathione lyase family enzyme